MSVLVFAELTKGKFKKTALEAVYYGAQVAKANGLNCTALVLGSCDHAASLGQYGADIVWHDGNSAFDHVDSQQYTAAIAGAAEKAQAQYIILASTSTGKTLLGRLGVKLNAAVISNANALPDGKVFRKGVFSGKALVYNEMASDKAVISVMGNSLQFAAEGGDTSVESISLNIPSARIEIIEQKTVEGTVPLPEAELVVSAGRGMKGPENWDIIEELADVLGATTACSRPVADTGWRPHHEHVGQTGVAIRPNLYIAAGISGAIQHLAGVNSSKVIVVINKDPEAPFFKAADYGVVGDLFEVVPRLTESLKKFKQSN